MKLNELSPKEGSKKDRTRVGRGIGSGKGKTAGRGHKGQKARSGVALNGFEGGQMPLYRRLPKFGFNNPFGKTYVTVNLGRLQTAIDKKDLDPKKTIDAQALIEAGVIRREKDGVKLLGDGELKDKVTLKLTAASKSAIKAVEKVGGTIELPKAKTKEKKLKKKDKTS